MAENAYSNLLKMFGQEGMADFDTKLKDTGVLDMLKNVMGSKSTVKRKEDLFTKFMQTLLTKKAELGLAEAQGKEQVAGQERSITANKESQLTQQSFQKQMQELSNAFNLDMFNKEWSKKMELYDKQKKDQEDAQSNALWQGLLGMGTNMLTGGLASLATKGVNFGQGLLLGGGGVGNILGQQLAPKTDLFSEIFKSNMGTQSSVNSPFTNKTNLNMNDNLISFIKKLTENYEDTGKA